MVAASEDDNRDSTERSYLPKSGSAFEQLTGLISGRPEVQITEDHVQSVLTVRRGRESLFGANLFSDPAWDIILELYAARLGNRTMFVSDLARVMGVRGTVVARWVSALVDSGVVRRDLNETEEPAVELTDDGAAKMARLVNQWSSAFVAI